MRAALPAVLALTLATAAAAQTPTQTESNASMAMPQPACTASAPLPAAYSSFAHPVPAAQGSGVFLGQAATLDLGPGTHFLVPPGHKPAAGTFGGMVGFDVIDPATYRVAVGAGVWVEIVQDGKAVRSTAHQAGPACSAVRKTVDFTLAPGHYTLQLSGSTTPSVTFQIAKAA